MGADNDEPEMSLDEVETIIQDLFHKYDGDGNGYLDPNEFKQLMNDLQARMDFPPDEVYRFLAEADMNEDGMIEYEEFIPLALQIVQGMYAKKRLEQHMVDVDQHAEDLLVHGMSRDELTDLVGSIFERMDQDGSGTLSKAEFAAALTSMELGLTRREINTVMFQIDQDNDGGISYREFVPFAFDLLQKLTSLRLLETELENDELAVYLTDMFKARDVEMTGTLHVNDIRDLLHEAMLGLSRMQIYTVISEAEVNSDNLVAYGTFIPRSVGLIRSMLSFEKSIVRDSKESGAEAENSFFAELDKAFSGIEVLPPAEFLSRLEGSSMMNSRELQACKHLLIAFGDEVPVEQAKSQIWSLVKNMRRHKGA
jgi:Ca2+-binding EF-hand superfamily protein